jgi:hypothetical protein
MTMPIWGRQEQRHKTKTNSQNTLRALIDLINHRGRQHQLTITPSSLFCRKRSLRVVSFRNRLHRLQLSDSHFTAPCQTTTPAATILLQLSTAVLHPSITGLQSSENSALARSWRRRARSRRREGQGGKRRGTFPSTHQSLDLY